jgi:hypothetical protein
MPGLLRSPLRRSLALAGLVLGVLVALAAPSGAAEAAENAVDIPQLNPNSTGGAITAVVATGLMALFVKKSVDWVRSLLAKDWNGVVTPLAAGLIGFGTVLLFANSSFGIATIPGLDVPVADLGVAECVIAAWTLFSLAGFVNDRNAAVDDTRSSATPRLIPEPPVNPPGGNA